MNKNFFELQRYYKRNSQILYVLFVMAMMLHVLLALLAFMIIWWLVFKNLDEFAWFWVIVLVPSYFLASVLYHYNKLIHHHDLLLKDINAKRLFLNISDVDIHDVPYESDEDNHHIIYANDIKDFLPKYQRYYEFAEQLAIACCIPLPKLYVMDDEGINAFVAGFHDEDMMLVLSEGALKLDNESLYGLIGHEYGHIIHGDARLNMKMYVLMSGLSWLYDVADGLEWLSQWRQKAKVNRVHYYDNKGNQQEYVIVDGIGRLSIEFMSLLVRLAGFLGMASSEYIKNHFNQQREFLADATSIQLTRSDGVLKLLSAIKQAPYLARTNRQYTTHLSYFFFLNPVVNYQKTKWHKQAGGAGSTHPHNDERILALKEGLYDDFAKMAVQNLDGQFLKRVHDDMMMRHYHDNNIVHYAKTEGANHINSTNHQTLKDVPVYHQDIEVSQDSVVHGRFVRDMSWDTVKDDVIFPANAKADYELKEVKYVSIEHIKNMHLPLIVAKFLRNDNIDRNQSKLFELFYAIMICHDSKSINLKDDIYLSNLLQIDGDIHKLSIDIDLLKAVSKMDRRIDNALLAVIYQRITRDLNHDIKKLLLDKDGALLMDLLSHHDAVMNDKSNILWSGVHFYRLSSLCCDNFEMKYHDIMSGIYKNYSISINDSIAITLIIYAIMLHDLQDKTTSTAQRLIRLLGFDIDDKDINLLIDKISLFGVVDIVLLLLNYHEENIVLSKRRLETFYTALLSDGVLHEREYEILFTLHDKWCQGLELVID